MKTEWVNIIISVLSGLAVAVPLAIKLIEYVKKAIKERNWTQILNMLMKYMEEAETKFESGADKKEWVMAMIKASADTVNYDVNMDVISNMIDELCNMSNVVNAPTEVAE